MEVQVDLRLSVAEAEPDTNGFPVRAEVRQDPLLVNRGGPRAADGGDGGGGVL
jgi:hypothetical protein